MWISSIHRQPARHGLAMLVLTLLPVVCQAQERSPLADQRPPSPQITVDVGYDGVAASSPPGGAPASPPRAVTGMLVGLRVSPLRGVGIDLRQQVVHGIGPLPSPHPAGTRPLAPETRLGIDFSPVSAGAELRRYTALRFELARGTVMSLKPRRGRVTVTLQSQW